MLRENTMIREAAAELQKAFKEGAGKDVIQAAFDKFGQAIAATVQADFETANGDVRVLAQRDFRQLTSEETKYYQALIDAGKQKNPKQVYDGLLDDKVMPNTVIEDVFKDLREEHPLLSRIRFQSVEYLTRWILNDHTVQTARWGDINDEITKEIVSAFQTIEITSISERGNPGSSRGGDRVRHGRLYADRHGQRHSQGRSGHRRSLSAEDGG